MISRNSCELDKYLQVPDGDKNICTIIHEDFWTLKCPETFQKIKNLH